MRLLATFGDLELADGRTQVVGEGAPAAHARPAPDVLDGGVLPGVSITEQLEYRALSCRAG